MSPQKKKWTQAFVVLSSCVLTVGKNGAQLPMQGATVLPCQADPEKKIFSVCWPENDSKVYYLQAQSPDQRKSWLTTFIEHGATVIFPPSKIASPEDACECRGWMKILSGDENARDPPEVHPIKAVTKKLLLTEQMNQMLKNDLENAHRRIERLTEQAAEGSIKRRGSQSDSDVAKLKRENASISQKLSSAESLVRKQAATIARLEQEKHDALVMRQKSDNDLKKNEEEWALGPARQARWSVLLMGGKDGVQASDLPSPSPARTQDDQEPPPPPADDSMEITELRAEVNRLMEANKALMEKLESERQKTKDAAEALAINKELQAVNTKLLTDLEDLKNSQKELEAGAEEVIETLEEERNEAQKQLAELRAAMDDGGAYVAQEGGLKAHASVSGLATELLRQLDTASSLPALDVGDAVVSVEVQELREEKRVLIDEICDTKTERDAMSQKVASMETELAKLREELASKEV